MLHDESVCLRRIATRSEVFRSMAVRLKQYESVRESLQRNAGDDTILQGTLLVVCNEIDGLRRRLKEQAKITREAIKIWEKRYGDTRTQR